MTPLHDVSVRGLRMTHFEQLLSYVDWAENEGTYYGNKAQFVKRHFELREWVESLVRQKENER